MKLDLSSLKSRKSLPELLTFSILNIDKPSGPTSFQVSHLIKHLLGVSKTSHGGTLDPAVSGVLPVMLSRACRLSDYLMHRDKTYVGIMRLHADVTDEQLQVIIGKFLGKIKQLPPVRSRVKRAIREREVKTFRVLERDGKDVLFETQVQAGTYIRKICDDMGRHIGGAHMLELRRTKAGMFEEKNAHTLYELEKAVEEYKKGNEQPLRSLLLPGEIISLLLPVVFVQPAAVQKLYRGSPLFVSFIISSTAHEKGEKVAVFDKQRFIGCYRIVNEGSVFGVPEFVLNYSEQH